MLIIIFDEWGGFFDDVAPPLAPIPAASAAAGDTDGCLGFRVPCIVISPMAKRATVSHEQFDHTSILRMIEWRWSLPALSGHHVAANNLADALDFTASPNPAVPQFDVPAGPFGSRPDLDCDYPLALSRAPNEYLRRSWRFGNPMACRR